ncbi:M3 family oligoendopeptidase [Fodinicurvata sp. EGI_FJ10296]|uniref:M3 family oligoendopeptidase n=1 Tax=Fodinicurvata sp. EGI_FJ10296 TaxID=3231908 RepID=UPI0034566161
MQDYRINDTRRSGAIPHSPDSSGDRAEALGDLPGWQLDDLYPGRESQVLKDDLQSAEADAKALHKRYAGRVVDLTGPELAEAIATYEAIDERLGRIMSYAYLSYAENMSDSANGRFLQAMQERVTAISADLIFFTLEINRIDDDALKRRLQDKGLARYAPWIRDVRAFKDHQLSDEAEKLLHEKSVVGRSAWVRLFDETMASLQFVIRGREMGSAEAFNCLSEPDADLRREAAACIGKVLGDNLRLFTHITNTLAKEKQIEDGWRHYAKPWSSRNVANQVEDEVVDALTEAVQSNYDRLSHRYYRMKARWMGGETIPYWDRNAPLPDAEDRVFTWPQARDIVLSAYNGFSPDLGAVGQRFFDNPWIDVPVRPGKAPGAFAHPTVPSAHPYLLLNYQGKTRDVMTLAHELGHGVHQVLAGERQGHLLSDTPLTLAETASVFGEMLTFQSLLDSETDPARRRIMLADKVEDMLNTVVRQIAFFEFERRVHTTRQEGELSSDQIGEIWMTVQRESLGPAVTFDDAYGAYWSYIPHFVHSPFYVYAYAFGDCLVNSLYAVYQQEPDGFAPRYLEMLAAGGTLRHKDLLAPFGLDASEPKFWNKGLDMIAGFIDQLEAEDAALKAAG